MVARIKRQSFSHSVCFASNLSGVVIEFKLATKSNTKASVHCNYVIKHSTERVRTIDSDALHQNEGACI